MLHTVSDSMSSETNSLFRDFDRNFLNELQCPVCTDYMVPPITLCTNGHNVCHKCRPQVDRCPTCRGAMLNTRNISLENIVRFQKYPCVNRPAGCNATFPVSLIGKHQAECSYGSYKCPVTNIPGVQCSWKGIPKYFKNHIKEFHSEFLIEGNSISCVSGTRAAVLFAMNEIFLNYQCVKGNKWYSAVQHVVTSNTTPRYVSRYKLRSDNNIEEIAETYSVQSWEQNFDSIFKSGRCFRHDDEVIRNFIKHEKLDLTVDIIKVNK